MQTNNFTVSKSQFKPKALEYLRLVEKNKKPLTITHAGKPVVRIVPFKDENNDSKIETKLKGTLLYYKDPTEPVGVEDWEALK